MDDMGINMAGVDVILRLSEKIVELQTRLQALEAEIEKYRNTNIEKKKSKSGG
jgi:hypothetical protein